MIILIAFTISYEQNVLFAIAFRKFLFKKILFKTIYSSSECGLHLYKRCVKISIRWPQCHI